MACSDLFLKLGVKKNNLTMIDSKGVINLKKKGFPEHGDFDKYPPHNHYLKYKNKIEKRFQIKNH